MFLELLFFKYLSSGLLTNCLCLKKEKKQNILQSLAFFLFSLPFCNIWQHLLPRSWTMTCLLPSLFKVASRNIQMQLKKKNTYPHINTCFQFLQFGILHEHAMISLQSTEYKAHQANFAFLLKKHELAFAYYLTDHTTNC